MKFNIFIYNRQDITLSYKKKPYMFVKSFIEYK